jgi:hypothetical protein
LLAILFTAAMLVRGTFQKGIERVLAALIDVKVPPDDPSAGDMFTSLVVFGGFLLMIGGIVGAVMLARTIYGRNPDAGKPRYWFAIGLGLAGIAAFVFALWEARRSPSGQIGFDVVLYTFAAALVGGLIAFAQGQGVAGRKGGVRLFFLLLALLHVAMYMIPVALVVKLGTPVAWVVFVVSSVASLPIGIALVRWRSSASGPLAVFAWLAICAWLVVIPFAFHVDTITEPAKWEIIPPLVLALAIGFLHCCIQFAWYLGVSHKFSGHNNEVGGASRIERFKQFIRFKVEPTKITGYVIAFDDPKQHGSQLDPKLVDVFTLTTKP